MIKKTHLLYSILLFSIASCRFIGPDWVFKESKSQPESYEYKLSEGPVCYTPGLDTNCVYVHSYEAYRVNAKYEIVRDLRTYYRHVRFTSKGICFMSAPRTSFPDVADVYHLNNISGPRGQYCHYTLCEGGIKIEFYNHTTNMFQYDYFNILPDGNLYFFREKGRPFGTYVSKKKMLYTKVCFDSLPPLIFPKGQSISED